LLIRAFGVTLAGNINPIFGVFSMHELAFLLQMPDSATTRHIASLILLAIPIIVIVFYVIIIVPFWFICKKAGFSPWLSLLNLIPLGGLILMYVLAFAEWNVVPAPQAVLQPPFQPPPLPPQV
jgi:hypothetical protein